MIGLIFTLDYEIYGDGEGSLNKLAVEPTYKFLEICDEMSVKTTLFVDVAEILAIKHEENFKEEVSSVENQLKYAHKNGHDIQLHIHPWWFNAKYVNGKWQFENKVMSLSDLDVDEAVKKILLCKQYLIELLKPIGIDYSCIAFRAGSWSMMPTENIFDSLTATGIKVDSSVFKWGKKETEFMKYDYSEAFSNIHPWFFSRENVNKAVIVNSNNSKCLEIPIYAEKKLGVSFLTVKRLLLMRKVRSVVEDVSSHNHTLKVKNRIKRQTVKLFGNRSKKLDFCKCSYNEMKKMIANISAQNPVDGYLPVVTIGHSKDFIYWKDLKKIIDLIKSQYSNVIEIVPLTTALSKFLNS